MEAKNHPLKLSNERLNFILALCAIIVSAASFYATYLQAEAANQQVKAMTYPMVQFSSGNYDDENQRYQLSLTIGNAGVGPAVIKSVSYQYKGDIFDKLDDFLKACCNPEYDIYVAEARVENNREKLPEVKRAQMITSTVNNRILPFSDNIQIFGLQRDAFNFGLWNKLNQERWGLDVKICYCSLLDRCYLSEKHGLIEEVNSCASYPAKINKG